MHPLRPSPFRGPLLVVITFVLALLALYPGASLRGQSAPDPKPNAGTVVAGSASGTLGETVDGEVSDLVLKGKQLQVTYRNTGSLATPIIGELQVRDENGEVVGAVPFVEGKTIDAGRTERFKVAMPSLPPGKYVLFAVVQFGGTEMAAAQSALEVLPPVR